MFLNYFIVFLILLLLALTYHRLALKFKIVDKPNHRSSHVHTTVRGGGILFPFAVIFWWMAFDFQHTWMILGIVWVATISLLDDIYTISSRIRFAVQFLALSMAFYDLGVFAQINWIALPILYFISLAVINGINFMDGINGITGLYGLVFLGSVLAVDTYLGVFDQNLIRYEILAICVFLIFNLRKKALMFAGDIGSISLAYVMIYLLIQWYLYSGSWTVILFLLIYGLDSAITIFDRIRKGEKISEPHRSHLYQMLANQAGISHVNIALIYALLQLGINFGFFIYPRTTPGPFEGLGIIVITGVVYIAIKAFLLKKYSKVLG
ncbi:UDP-N-acetylmuramyl pentapeptide phosphotransferase/UDP-N-acetylglucosamine-1-phosphate transferase [Algoriphagus yeomjeoni]|uniref:UDP-N-acetylmuramyl pentapeptide phosphotransferase/UDP-N-acetylglucosamine-1-phosphate transferase n=1 Tax=Algoriphagus yeomjeoni TaxID=291403 RepID=A0A327P6I5_9BACT|nr:UDP-N-acetylmuramyl pentapeptide phosphotransferase/UDP-N-acetylglucosamine-1-phosphate transferase [Algoriphagus yeomjeoni]